MSLLEARKGIGSALLSVVAIVSTANAQGVTDAAKRGDTMTVSQGDALMEEAKKKGQATLAEFLLLAQSPEPGLTNFSVKVGLPTRSGLEFVWMRPFTVKDGRITGQVRNEPRQVPNVKIGDRIVFDKKDVVDWSYLDRGKMKGNFTACALLKTRPQSDRDAFKKEYGLDCDLQ